PDHFWAGRLSTGNGPEEWPDPGNGAFSAPSFQRPTGRPRALHLAAWWHGIGNAAVRSSAPGDSPRGARAGRWRGSFRKEFSHQPKQWWANRLDSPRGAAQFTAH